MRTGKLMKLFTEEAKTALSGLPQRQNPPTPLLTFPISSSTDLVHHLIPSSVEN
jgi:hypothetical protein